MFFLETYLYSFTFIPFQTKDNIFQVHLKIFLFNIYLLKKYDLFVFNKKWCDVRVVSHSIYLCTIKSDSWS